MVVWSKQLIRTKDNANPAHVKLKEFMKFQKARPCKKKEVSDLYAYEKKFWKKNLSVCGIDEVGRGCLAGPVVTATVILRQRCFHPDLADSKTLTHKKIVEIYNWLLENSQFNIGINSQRIIDKKNIYQATLLTMRQATLNLFSSATKTPSLVLIDAMPPILKNTKHENIETLSLIKGESKSASIAAASVIAKVTRDRLMARLSGYFPTYNLEKHKGYGTRYHISKIIESNESILHRKSFLKKIKPTKENCEQQSIFGI